MNDSTVSDLYSKARNFRRKGSIREAEALLNRLDGDWRLQHERSVWELTRSTLQRFEAERKYSLGIPPESLYSSQQLRSHLLAASELLVPGHDPSIFNLLRADVMSEIAWGCLLKYLLDNQNTLELARSAWWTALFFGDGFHDKELLTYCHQEALVTAPMIVQEGRDLIERMKRTAEIITQAKWDVIYLVPAFNESTDAAQRTIESLVEQDTSLNVGILYVDDGSSNEYATASWVEQRFRDLVREFKLCTLRTHRGGAAAARNCGLKIAENSNVALIGFLDSSDVALPGRTNSQVSFLFDHPTIDMVHGKARFVDETGSPYRSSTVAAHYYRLWGDSRSRWKLSDARSIAETEPSTIHAQTVMLRKEIVSVSGMQNIFWPRAQDFRFWREICLSGGQVAFQNVLLSEYCIKRHAHSTRWWDWVQRIPFRKAVRSRSSKAKAIESDEEPALHF